MDSQLSLTKGDPTAHLMSYELQTRSPQNIKSAAHKQVKGQRLEEEDHEAESTNKGTVNRKQITLKVGESRQIQFDLDDIDANEDIMSLKRKYFQSELDSHLNIRIILMGRVLNDSSLVHSYKWTDGQVALVHISQSQLITQVQPMEQAAIPIEIPAQDIRQAQIQALMAELEQLEQQNQIRQIGIQNIDQIQALQNEQEGSYLDLIVGIFLGFVFAILALLGLCFCQCSVKAKQGVMIGFIIRIIYTQIVLMQSTTSTTGRSN